jgi:type II secretory pathway pseudopilin PulG
MRVPKACVSDRGFTLAEVVICAGLLVAVASGVSQLLSMAIRTSDAARTRTLATLLAVQRMEQLRGLAWGAKSDLVTDLSTDPPGTAGRGLQPSPAGSLDANMPSYVDHLTGDGEWAGSGSVAPADAVYTRRWSVRPLDTDPAHTLRLEVLVTRARGASGQDVHLVSIRARRR